MRKLRDLEIQILKQSLLKFSLVLYLKEIMREYFYYKVFEYFKGHER